jgi:hypothetical protein
MEKLYRKKWISQKHVFRPIEMRTAKNNKWIYHEAYADVKYYRAADSAGIEKIY